MQVLLENDPLASLPKVLQQLLQAVKASTSSCSYPAASNYKRLLSMCTNTFAKKPMTATGRRLG